MTSNLDITDPQATPLFDSHRPLVLKGGHVGCALTRQDGVADVLIENGLIAEVAPEIHVPGAVEVDVSNHWVLPGVIDSHCHLGSTFGSVWGARMSLRSGVTLGIDMAGPLEDIKAHAHLGGGYQVAVMTALESEALDPYKSMEKSLNEGAWGMKNLGGHYPLSIERGFELIDAGVRYGGAVAWHAGSTTAGSNILGMLEAARVAQGMPLHMAHINAYCRGRVYDAKEEVAIALACLEQNPNLYSESYLCPGNATMLDTLPDGRLEDAVTAMCVEKFGFEPNAQGLKKRLRRGFARSLRWKGNKPKRSPRKKESKPFYHKTPRGISFSGVSP